MPSAPAGSSPFAALPAATWGLASAGSSILGRSAGGVTSTSALGVATSAAPGVPPASAAPTCGSSTSALRWGSAAAPAFGSAPRSFLTPPRVAPPRSLAPFMPTPIAAPMPAACVDALATLLHGSPPFQVLSSSMAPTAADGMPWTAFSMASAIASLIHARIAAFVAPSAPSLATAFAAWAMIAFSRASMRPSPSPAVSPDTMASTAPIAASVPISSQSYAAPLRPAFMAMDTAVAASAPYTAATAGPAAPIVATVTARATTAEPTWVAASVYESIWARTCSWASSAPPKSISKFARAAASSGVSDSSSGFLPGLAFSQSERAVLYASARPMASSSWSAEFMGSCPSAMKEPMRPVFSNSCRLWSICFMPSRMALRSAGLLASASCFWNVSGSPYWTVLLTSRSSRPERSSARSTSSDRPYLSKYAFWILAISAGVFPLRVSLIRSSSVPAPAVA